MKILKISKSELMESGMLGEEILVEVPGKEGCIMR